MRRLPGPASSPLCDGVETPEAHHELFRGWQRTQTQSSVRTLWSLRQQMDVWFCLMQESSAERHCCVTADSDWSNCAPSGARPEILCFSLDRRLTWMWTTRKQHHFEIPRDNRRSFTALRMTALWAKRMRNRK